MPERIQRKRERGWKMPPNTVCVTRPSVWGNPFAAPNPEMAVEAYRRLISGGTQSFNMGPGKLQFARNANRRTLHWNFASFVCENIGSLRGKNLACFCPLGSPCHADILLEIANRET
jgi:hypothetical protein